MEEKLVELFKMANEFNKKQDNYYIQIEYSANDMQRIEMALRSKIDYSFIRHYKICLQNDPLVDADEIIKLFKICIGGVMDETDGSDAYDK